MTRNVHEVDRDELPITRRELATSAAVVAGVSIASSASAQSGPQDEISGSVTESGSAVDGAEVIAVPHSGSLRPLQTTTDASGSYEFPACALHGGDNLYHVICRDGTETNPKRGQENYPFISATGDYIPCSARNRWKYDEGSGSTVADSIGSADGTITGATWISGTYIGDYALDFDGTDDYVDVGELGSFGSSLDTDWSLSLTIEGDIGGGGRLVSVHNANDDTVWQLGLGGNNVLRVRMRDQNGDEIRVETDDSMDSSKHRIVVVKSSNSADGVDVYVDDEIQGTVMQLDESFSDPSNFDSSVVHGARNVGGSVDLYYGGIIDDPIVYSDSLTRQQVSEDYDRQPWS